MIFSASRARGRGEAGGGRGADIETEGGTVVWREWSVGELSLWRG
jgi:hypothetical protein